MGDGTPRPGAGLRFSKMHGAGNDFVVLDLRDGAPPPTPALCRALADRHTGVGCDQILAVEPARRADSVAGYRIFNADGSVARQCGNGARCIAAWLLRDGAAQGPRFMLDSPAGTHAVECLDGGDLRIAMGVPDFAAASVPLAGFDPAQDAYTLDVDGAAVTFGVVSMGNPHAVVEVDAADDSPVAVLGPALQRHAAFPESVNVGFAEVVARDRVRLRVYERGVGETLACGSGACAAAAVLMRRGRVDRELDVVLPGGTLRLAWQRDAGEITMAGPATFVYEGEWIA
ncbi:diaminopimelate epimerase [Luteimonas salinilitoris]|uniref:Diaminopimelate epimerase n=1 Tax=Luteimonas salinilitoris TaxID=3237697 RepID=A0ABV4HZ70_9GAMM